MYIKSKINHNKTTKEQTRLDTVAQVFNSITKDKFEIRLSRFEASYSYIKKGQ